MLMSGWSIINEHSCLKNTTTNNKNKTDAQVDCFPKCYLTLEQMCERCERSRELLLTQRHQAINSGIPTSQSDPICSAPDNRTKRLLEEEKKIIIIIYDL